MSSRSPIGCTHEQPSPSSFNSWCKKHKIIWPKCKVGMSEQTGRCVLASRAIRAGEVVVEVPDGAVLMAENCAISGLLEEEGLVKPADDALLEVQGLVLAVMVERSRGAESRWGPYLSFLPQDLTHMPLYWQESELQELRGTAAWDKMVGRVQHPADAPTRVQQLFAELVLPIVQAHEDVCRQLLGSAPADVDEEAARKLLWPQYQWATAAVASYSFVLGDEQYQGMVPVWDLLNHVTGAVNVRLHHDPARGVLQMIATEDIPSGAEVVNCYGQLSNAELLRGYGYVESHNTHKHMQVPAQFLIRAAAAAAAPQPEQQQQQSGQQTEEEGEDGQGEQSGGDEPSEPEQEGSSGSDDESQQGHSSSEDEEDEEEPDWDLEDDSESEEQQQHVPSLAAAQQRIPDWEDRWQLCHSLRLLPKNGVFQVSSLAALPPQLLPVLLLLMADERDCERLAAKAAAATAAGKAAAAAAAAATKRRKAARKDGRRGEKKPSAAAAVAAAAAAAVGDSDVYALKFISSPKLLLSAMRKLVGQMQSRYTSSLEQDRQLLEQQQHLAPRLAAAVMARVAELEVLAGLEQALQTTARVAEQLMQQARDGISAALREVQAAAAADKQQTAGAAEHHCCHVPGCPHDHEHEHGAAAAVAEEPASAGRTKSGSCKRSHKQAQQLQDEDAAGAEDPGDGGGGGKKQRGAKKRRQQAEAAAAPAANTAAKRVGAQGKEQAAAAGFSFNFNL